MLKLFSGTANPQLSEEVAKLLKLKLTSAEIVRFGNSEVRVRIEEDVRYSNCVVIQPTTNPSDTNLMELFFFCDALRRQEAKKVIGIIPCFGYARQDIQHREGECVSANVVIKFLESIGFSKIYTVDLHDEATSGVFSIPFKNLSAIPLLADEVKKYLKTTSSDKIANVSPDQGGVERARDFGGCYFGNYDFPLAVIEKKRNLTTIHRTKALDLYGNVDGKTAVLVDDIVTSGGTLINAVELCLERGAKNVLAAVVHHDFSDKAPQKLQNSPLEKFFSTNTIALRKDQEFSKLVEVSVAPIIAEQLTGLVKKP